MKVICKKSGDMIIKTIRDLGQPVTKFVGEGMDGPVNELYIACRRKDLRNILAEILKIDSQVFYVVEQASAMTKILRPMNTPLGGWRSRSNRK